MAVISDEMKVQHLLVLQLLTEKKGSRTEW